MTHASHHFTLADIARQLGIAVSGNAQQPIRGLATLKEAQPDQVAFLANRAYLKDLATTKAAAVLLHPEHGKHCPVARLEIDNPYLGYAKLSQLFDPLPARDIVGIHPTAVVAADTIIGEATRLHANVTLCHGVVIGKRGILQSGCVIGGDGFGFAHDGAGWHKIAQLGGVVLGDDVEVGSCSSIDRGALGDTVIGDDVKIDSQVQIAHNVIIGDHSALAGCVGIAGSTKVGKHCMLGGGVGLSGHLTICDGVQVTGMSLVTNSIHEPGVYSSGTGAMANAQWRKNAVRFKQLDDIAKRLARLEKKQRE